MATLVLQAAGTVIGGLIGGPMGAALGGALGASLGMAADQVALASLTRPGRRVLHGPRLRDLDGVQAQEGAPIPRLYGRARLGGQVIWATRIAESANVTRRRARGGKGRALRPPSPIEVRYSYSMHAAIALCEGPIAFVRRIWADGQEIDPTTITLRVHTGEEDQPVDPLIATLQGAGAAPAYRGVAYVVFEALPLEPYGNRLPQFTFEVVRPVGRLNRRIRAVNIIPGAGEAAYATTPVVSAAGQRNRHLLSHRSDWEASLDQAQALLPGLERASLVVTWFGDDLRCGATTIRPRVEPDSTDAVHAGAGWTVAGLTRENAMPVSHHRGRAAYGGTPSDPVVIAALRDLARRGLAVTLYPFIMMDVPPDNGLPDPRTGAPQQPPYPWRGRITVDPGPGRPGTAEGTAAAAAQIAAFFGTAAAHHFNVVGDTITYSGPEEWGFRRHILHHAALARAAGAVDTLLLGSELVGLTRVRGPGGSHPAVDALCALAAEVRLLLGPAVKLAYAADWTEYGADVRAGGADVTFPLDPFFADPAIDAVAIDWYPPLADWRDGIDHGDAARFAGPRDPALLAANVAGGEAFDWYYASDAERAAGLRRPIEDGSHGKPFVFRPKDLVGWWSSPHRPRAAGVEQAPTPWQPGMKPIWLMEIGCPAVDRGANAPNLFPDPKSAEGALPPFSRGGRDDLIQTRAIAAIAAHFDPAAPGFVPAANPLSSVYAGRMVDPARTHVWAWDARPFPAFPQREDVWADGGQWATGHWINGRLEGAPAEDVVAAILADRGEPPPTGAVDGFLDGYVIDRPMGAREAIEPLADLFGFSVRLREGATLLSAQPRPRADLTLADTVLEPRVGPPVRRRLAAGEVAERVTLSFSDGEDAYRRGAVAVGPEAVAGERPAVEVGVVLSQAIAEQRARAVLRAAQVARDRLSLALPPSARAWETGDAFRFGGRAYRIERIRDGRFREIEAVAVEPLLADTAARPLPLRPLPALALPSPARPLVLDLPIVDGEPAALQHVAVTAAGWAGGYTLWRETPTGLEAVGAVPAPAQVGTTLDALPAGPLWRHQPGVSLRVAIPGGALASVGRGAALAGAALFALETPDGRWEVLSAAGATLEAPDTWRLSGLLRGWGGSEPLAALPRPAGMRIVALDGAVLPLLRDPAEAGREAAWRLVPTGRDPADPLAVRFAATPGLLALRPLAPVHPRALRGAEGVRITWVRRARTGGDSWDIADVPLAEEREAYRLAVLADGSERRIGEVERATWLYAAADELADFGAPQPALALRIAQVSRLAGPGAPWEGIVPVR